MINRHQSKKFNDGLSRRGEIVEYPQDKGFETPKSHFVHNSTSNRQPEICEETKYRLRTSVVSG